MAKLNSLKNINRRYHSSIRAMSKGAREKEILESLANGKNSYLRLDRVESSAFDKSWIETIEDVIFDLGEIIANPKQVTKAEGNVVPIELAKKINAESVQHLASHTQYIKEIDDYGNVIPSKVLSIISDDDIRTYENRFIATFVRRLVLFIEKRYEIVSQFAELHDEEVLYFKNKSFVDGANVEIETKIKISHKSDDELSLKSNAYVARIKEMRRYILYFYESDFMKKLKTEKDVHNPILQTNIIRKNPKYHHCYEVYKFIERYDSLGVNYKVDEHYSLFNEDELKELNNTLFANYITLRGKDRSKNAKTSSKVYKPKILTSMDDESFIYGPLLSGPIEFVRIDQGYQDYLDSKLKKDLPLHPTKQEKEYYEDEYAAKAENKQDLKQKNDLIKRTEKAVKAFNKKAEKIDKEREQARLDLLRQEQEIIKQEEHDLLEAARNELINASLMDKAAQEQEAAEKEKELIANIKPAVVPVEMSHPVSKPVTYDEAVDEIWPQLNNPAPIKEEPVNEVQEQPVINEQPQEQVPVQPVSEPVNEEQPVEEAPAEEPVQEYKPEDIKPAVVPVEMSHPASKPVSYDEAVDEIWPQLNKPAPAPTKVAKKKEQPQEQVKPVPVASVSEQPAAEPAPVEEPIEEAPVEEAPEQEPVQEYKPEDIKPAVVPIEMSHPHSEPVSYDEAVDEIWPQLNAPAPVAEEAPSKEAPTEEPVEETPVVVVPSEEIGEPDAEAEEPTEEQPIKKKQVVYPIQTRQEILSEYRMRSLRGIAMINFDKNLTEEEKEEKRVDLKRRLIELRDAKLKVWAQRERAKKKAQQQEKQPR